MQTKYSEKPFIIEAKQAHKNEVVTYKNNGTAAVDVDGVTYTVTPSQQFDLTQATLFGLNERLTSAASSPAIENGKTLREFFNEEWQAYTEAITAAAGGVHEYGVYAFYHQKNHLVRYAPEFWHKVVAVASNSKLIADVSGEMSWWDIRECFRNTTVAVAGGSVGNSILHSTVMDMRPDVVKIADKAMYKMENINRVRLSYENIVAPESSRVTPTDLLLQNKARVTASQLYAIDPYLSVYTYDEGISEDAIEPFLGGKKGEPAADIIVEEVDDPRMKLLVRERARQKGIPLIMLTDIGSSVQLDVMRYDQDQNLPLAHGIEDDELKRIMEEFYDNPAERKLFFAFVDALIGKHYRRDELKDIILERCEIPTSTVIPQLGSTVMVSGGIAAETIARIRLGYEYPKRALINKKTLSVSKKL